MAFWFPGLIYLLNLLSWEHSYLLLLVKINFLKLISFKKSFSPQSPLIFRKSLLQLASLSTLWVPWVFFNYCLVVYTTSTVYMFLFLFDSVGKVSVTIPKTLFVTYLPKKSGLYEDVGSIAWKQFFVLFEGFLFICFLISWGRFSYVHIIPKP